jgi:hypothetical protein
MAESRQDRALRQRLLLADSEIRIENGGCTFQVIGSKGDFYNVKIDKFPHCDCLDYKNRQIACKHIYFVLSRVLHQPEEIWKKGSQFTDEQVLVFLEAARKLQESRECWLEVDEVDHKQPRSVEDQKECCVCLCDFVKEEKLIFCYNVCGYNVHELCFLRMKKDQCPMCRAEMKIRRKKAVKRKAVDELPK